MKNDFEQQLEKARTIWEENSLNNVDYVLLLPHQDNHLNDLISATFKAKLGTRSGIIFENEQALTLLELYSVYAFTDKLIIGSFSEPYGRKLFNLVDCGIATADTLINDVILGAL